MVMSSIMEPPTAPEAAQLRTPLERHLLIQADQFCGCGYNLHGQRVAFDERLDIPIARCPECGKWHAAGHGSTAGRSWLARLGSIALFAWCLFILLAISATLALVFGVTMGVTVGDTVAIAVMEDGRQIVDSTDATGNPIAAQVVGTGQQVQWQDAAFDIRYVYPDDPRAAYPYYGWSNTIPRAAKVILHGIAWTAGLLLGIFLATVLWHLRRGKWFLPALMLLPAAAVMGMLYIDDAYSLLLPGAWRPVGTMAGGALVAMIVGLLIGRSVARAAVVALVPPRPRQMLAFLWLTDDKTPPAVTA